MATADAVISVMVAMLVQARTDQGLTQRDLAPRVGTRQAELSLWETNRRLPSLPNLIAWAHALSFDLGLFPRETP